MKHINITNWQGNITDWTKFNYIYGGIGNNLADRVNLSIKGTNLRNYLRKSKNLLQLANTSGTRNGITYKVENGVITFSGTASANFNIALTISLSVTSGSYTHCQMQTFPSGLSSNVGISGSAIDGNNQSFNYSRTFSVASDTTSTSMYFVFSSGTNVNGLVCKPIVITGSTVPTTYEPYDSMVLVENVGTVDLGTQDWKYNSQYQVFYCWVDGKAKGRPNAYCAKYTTVDKPYEQLNNKELTGSTVSNGINIKDTDYTTAQAFRTAMNGVYLTYELETPKITIIRTVTISSDREPWETRPNYTYADRFVTGAHDIPAGADGYVNWYGFEYYTNASVETYPYVANNNGRQIIVNFSAKGTTTLEQFKEYVSKNPLIITWWEEGTSVSTLSMASPMQLDSNSEETLNKQINEESVE